MTQTNSDLAARVDCCVRDVLRALSKTACVLLVRGPQIYRDEYQPEYPRDTLLLYLDVTLGSESWLHPRWFSEAPDDADQARQDIEEQEDAVQSFIANLERLDGISFFIAWHVEGAEESGEHSRGLDRREALRTIAYRLGDELVCMI